MFILQLYGVILLYNQEEQDLFYLTLHIRLKNAALFFYSLVMTYYFRKVNTASKTSMPNFVGTCRYYFLLCKYLEDTAETGISCCRHWMHTYEKLIAPVISDLQTLSPAKDGQQVIQVPWTITFLLGKMCCLIWKFLGGCFSPWETPLVPEGQAWRAVAMAEHARLQALPPPASSCSTCPCCSSSSCYLCPP